MATADVKALHQEELLLNAHAIAREDFSLVTRPSVEEAMVDLKVDIPDVINVLRTCHTVTMNFAEWPCAEYHGRTSDGDPLVVVAVIHKPEKTVKILKVWKG